MSDSDEQKPNIDLKADIDIKANLDPVLSAAPTGVRFVFNMLFGKKHATMERMVALAAAQNSVDVKKILTGVAVYDHGKDELVDSVIFNPRRVIGEVIRDAEVSNLIECSSKAAPHIDDSVDSEPADEAEEFISRWKSEAKNISTEAAQAIWGRVLAAEVNVPGSISLRTLDAIKNMSQKEASIFNEACKYVFFDDMLADNTKGDPISSADFSSIKDAGLIASYTPGIYSGARWPDGPLPRADGGSDDSYWVRCKDILIFVTKADLAAANLDAPSFTKWQLTQAGRELYRIICRDLEIDVQQSVEALFDKLPKMSKLLKCAKFLDVEGLTIDSSSIRNVF